MTAEETTVSTVSPGPGWRRAGVGLAPMWARQVTDGEVAARIDRDSAAGQVIIEMPTDDALSLVVALRAVRGLHGSDGNSSFYEACVVCAEDTSVYERCAVEWPCPTYLATLLPGETP